MKRRAFTLIEVLVVISVIALLVGILMPSLGKLKAVGVSAKCKRNLKDIGLSFTLAKASQDCNTMGGGYPDSKYWPETPYQWNQVDSIYQCPSVTTADFTETAPPASTQDVMGRFQYFSPMGKTDGTGLLRSFTSGASVITRRGQENGRWYTEYLVENDGSAPSWDRDDDGIWRLWDIAKGEKRKFTLMHYHCGWWNGLYMDGKPYWPHPLTTHVNDSVMFAAVYTDYGINKNSGQLSLASGDKILVLDFNGTIADPGSSASEFNSKLLRSARHDGKINVLFGNHSVDTFGPTELSPLINPRIWRP
jgi:prepilin-type N-terminal cleavage/methylation domain-containing protein